jgi:diguanylate cyclase (GGDEF)-like protein
MHILDLEYIFYLKSLAVTRTKEMSIRKLWDTSKQFLPIFMASAIGAALSIGAGLLVSQWEDRVGIREFHSVAENQSGILQNGIDQYLSRLVALRALFESSRDEISRRQFEIFAERILRDQTAIQSVSWIPRVSRAERAARERAAVDDGIPGYHIKAVGLGPNGSLAPSPERDEYFPIFYSTEKPKTSPVFGIDLASERKRRETLERAWRNNKPATFADFRLHTGTGDQFGFIVVLPMYRQDLPSDTEEERERNLIGFVQGAFQTSVMIETILAAAPKPVGIDVFLFSTSADPSAPPVNIYASRGRAAPPQPATQAALMAGIHWSGELRAGDGRWTLVALPASSEKFGIGHDRAWIILIAGLLVSGVVVAYLWASGRYARRVEVLALTDPLTTLANRRAFLERLTMAFATSRRSAGPFAVLFLDLDDFKDVNDTLGHAIGDALLRQVVQRLRNTVRPADLVARFGGDEFAILQADASDPVAAATLAARVGTCLAAPFEIEGHEVRITASIGISPYSADVAGPAAMMMQADLALYRAKGDGRNCFRFHTGELDQEVHLRVTLAEELRLAIGGTELELYYQPQVEINSGKILGLEALVRWNHPTRGLIMPSIFIPIAERTGTIVPLGHWAFEQGCRQLKRWRDLGIAPELLAVNVSGVQVKRASDLALEIAASLARWDIDPGNIEVELTETVLMEITQKHGDTLERLRQLGVRIAIDDFGTGYSSMKYLTIYPVNRLKLAQELVFRVTTDPRNATVVRAAIRLAQELGIEVIAEGVETEAQADFLLSAGCAYAQGYYFSRPVNAERATELLQQGKIEFPGMPIPRLGLTAA